MDAVEDQPGWGKVRTPSQEPEVGVKSDSPTPPVRLCGFGPVLPHLDAFLPLLVH